jgi:hypothetical protein
MTTCRFESRQGFGIQTEDGSWEAPCSASGFVPQYRDAVQLSGYQTHRDREQAKPGDDYRSRYVFIGE